MAAAGVRNLVEQRAGTPLPPRSPQVADQVAGQGPGILDLLPRSAHGLHSDENSAVLRTAATISGDRTYAVLAVSAAVGACGTFSPAVGPMTNTAGGTTR
ncbi:hypothetical protein GCM10009544_04320 [Streptomyces stramineus]|uniref:Uncharacterized protein n=1 Tax=Streptomyces stramineus TaxID=173861 RepID=A0ABP3J7G9_9ACTN